MDADLSSLFLAAGLAIAVGTTALVMLVRRDLAPAGHAPAAPQGYGRFFLGAALGVGVIAFSLKMIILTVLSNFPAHTIRARVVDAGTELPAGTDLASWADQTPFAFRPLPETVPAPADNPTTPEKVALGEQLFHDTRLSSDGTVSCASCHDVTTGFGNDARPTAIGVTRVPGKRNAPTVYNAAFQARMFWDGRAGSLEEQAGGPPLNPDEMGMPSNAAIEAKIAADPNYETQFAAAFGDDGPITMKRITQAIAAYERTLVTRDSPYDRFVAGDRDAMTARQQRGMWLFQTVGCVNCHSGPNFSGASLVGPKNPYAPLFAHRSDYARRHDLAADKGKAEAASGDGTWRIPTLRNVALTGPWFHNGAVDDLKEVVRVMATAQLNARISDDLGLRQEPRWSEERKVFETVPRVVLSERDIDDLVAFLQALTSDMLAARAKTADPS